MPKVLAMRSETFGALAVVFGGGLVAAYTGEIETVQSCYAEAVHKYQKSA